MRRRILHIPVLETKAADAAAARRMLPAVRLLESRIARIRRTPSWLRHRGRETLSPDMVSVHRARGLPLLPMVAVEVDEEPAARITDLSDGERGITIVNHGQTVGLSNLTETRIDFAHDVVGCAGRALEILATGIECPTVEDMAAVVRNVSRLIVEAHPDLDDDVVQVGAANLWAGFSVRTPFGERPATSIAANLSNHGFGEAGFDHWMARPGIAFLSLHFIGDTIVVGRPQYVRPPRHEDGIGALRDAATDVRLEAIVDAIHKAHPVP